MLKLEVIVRHINKLLILSDISNPKREEIFFKSFIWCSPLSNCLGHLESLTVQQNKSFWWTARGFIAAFKGFQCIMACICMFFFLFFFLLMYQCFFLSRYLWSFCLYFIFLHRHPTSCCSAAELMSVLFFHAMRYKADDPRNQCNDRFVLSKVLKNSFFFVIFYKYLSCSWPEALFFTSVRVTLRPSCMLSGQKQVLSKSLIWLTCARLTVTWRDTPPL